LNSSLELGTPVTSLRGVGPSRGKALGSLKVQTVKDLLLHFPRRYEDRRKISLLCELEDGKPALVVGNLCRLRSVRTRRRDGRGNLLLVSGELREGPEKLRLSWFNRPGLVRSLVEGKRIAVFGKVERDETGWVMSSPEIEVLGEGRVPQTGILPLYPLAAGLSQAFLRTLIRFLLESAKEKGLLEETLPARILSGEGFPGLSQAIQWLHYPPDEKYWKKARDRIAFEELFSLQAKLRKNRLTLEGTSRAPLVRPGKFTEAFLEKGLPFRLTASQQKALSEIIEDLGRYTPMRRLLHGDVGSGKTAVALGASMAVIDSGLQVAFMVPTEVLAWQHYRNNAPILSRLGVCCGVLTSGCSPDERKHSLQALEQGVPGLFFGTQALFQEGTGWKKLGFVVVDEQHRFGVEQKAALVGKGNNPHLLVMSATPIPRTLTLTAYGELDVTSLRDKLPGRKTVRTFILRKESLAKLMVRVRKEILSGGQVLWVCPFLQEREEDMAVSALKRLGEIKENLPDVEAGLIHGQMPAAEKDRIMEGFVEGGTGLLVATTVVEVGIDVAGATMIVVEDAERFGLSQLHQLRGRVGRGSGEGICVLLTSAREKEVKERLEIVVAHTDGLKIAEEDLKLRGPGSLCGTRQHGVTEFRVADLSRDLSLVELARRKATSLKKGDPLLDFNSWLSDWDRWEEEAACPVLG